MVFIDNGLYLVANTLVARMRRDDLQPFIFAYSRQFSRLNGTKSRSLYRLVAEAANLDKSLPYLVRCLSEVEQGI